MKKLIPVECWTRVVGYFRPINQVNNGKAEEIRQRREMPTKELNKYLEECVENEIKL